MSLFTTTKPIIRPISVLTKKEKERKYLHRYLKEMVNSKVEVQVKNVNPFALETNLSFKNKKAESRSSGFSFGSLLSKFSGFSNLAILNPASGESRGSSMYWSEEDELSIRLDAALEALQNDMTNPHLSKNEIIEKLNHRLAAINDPRLSDPDTDFHLFISNLKAIIQSNKLEMLDYVKRIESLSAEQNELVSRGSSSALMQHQEIEAYATALDDKINYISKSFDAVNQAEFSKTYQHQITEDQTEIELKFLSRNEKDESEEFRTRKIEIKSRGGIKIDSGIAIPLTNFGSSSKDFYIDQNGVIQGDKNDHFNLNIGLLVNFYPYIGETLNVGGSFGAAVPFSDNLKGINFLLGPSLHFGQENRISISGGAVFGPVEKLYRGATVGETTSLTSLDNYIKSVYDVGWFVGISFNLLGI